MSLEEFKQELKVISAELGTKGELVLTFPLETNKRKRVKGSKDKESDKEEPQVEVNKMK